jgi:hypothetical protein
MSPKKQVKTDSKAKALAALNAIQNGIKFLLCRWRPGKCGFRNSVKKNRPNVVFNTKSFYFSDLQKGSPELRFQYKKFLFFRPSERFSQNVVFNTNSFDFTDLQKRFARTSFSIQIVLILPTFRKGSPERRFQYNRFLFFARPPQTAFSIQSIFILHPPVPNRGLQVIPCVIFC